MIETELGVNLTICNEKR